MAIKPRSFLRNPLLLLLLVAGAIPAAMALTCPNSGPTSSATVQTETSAQTEVAKQHVRASETAALVRAAQVHEERAAKADQKGWLGVRIQTLNTRRAQYAGVEPSAGVLVLEVQPGMPAEISGFVPYDVVTHVDKRPVRTACQLKKRIAAAGPDKRVAVRVIREGVPVVLYPTLTSAAKAPGCGCGK